MEEKIIALGEDATKRFLEGINIMDVLVGGTLGPYGMNRIIHRKYRSPLITNDGVTIARNVYLKDEIADLAAQTLVEIAMKTNDTAGDGTTTSIVIASELIRDSMKTIADSSKSAAFGIKGKNAMQVSRDIYAALPEVFSLLEKQKHILEGDEIDDVISTSLENLEYGKTLGVLIRDVGIDGYVSVEDNWGTKYGIETETTKGMRFLGTYASPYLANERNAKEAVWEDTYVLVTNEKIETPVVLKSLIQEMQVAKKRRLVIIGGFSESTSPFSKEFISGLAQVMNEAAKGNPEMIQILAVKTPTLTSDELEDVATFLDGTFYDKNLGRKIEDARMIHLGFAKKFVVGEDDVNIIGGKGDPTIRIGVLKEQVELEKDPMFKEKLLRRIASLSSGVGIIRVGAPTEQERTYLKYKLEDAVNAAKAALEEGIVPGGGLALKSVAEALGEKNLLYKALMAPYERIQNNAPEAFEIGESIKDPYKVVRLALTNAVSAAAQLISSNGAIATRRLTVLDYFEKKLGKINPATDDFRDIENQDQGRGRLI